MYNNEQELSDGRSRQCEERDPRKPKLGISINPKPTIPPEPKNREMVRQYRRGPTCGASGVAGDRSCTSVGWEPPLAILARRFIPDIERRENVSTQKGSHNIWEPFALTPTENASGVSVPQIAATFLDCELASPIPPARAWLREERTRVQKLHRPCCAAMWNPLLREPLMQFTLQRHALCALAGLHNLHVYSSHSHAWNWNRKNGGTPEGFESGCRTSRRHQNVSFWNEDSISPPCPKLQYSRRGRHNRSTTSKHQKRRRGVVRMPLTYRFQPPRTLTMEWRRWWKAMQTRGNWVALPLPHECPSNDPTGPGGHQRPPQITHSQHVRRPRSTGKTTVLQSEYVCLHRIPDFWRPLHRHIAHKIILKIPEVTSSSCLHIYSSARPLIRRNVVTRSPLQQTVGHSGLLPPLRVNILHQRPTLATSNLWGKGRWGKGAKLGSIKRRWS